MANVTVTNLLTTKLNDFDELTGGVGQSALLAVGGSRKDPLPHPFNLVVLDEAGGTAPASTLPVHPRDFGHKSVPWLTHEPGEEWNRMVQEGKVSLSFASADGDVEEGAEAIW